MKKIKSYLWLGALAVAFVGCQAPLKLSKISPQKNISIKENLPSDAKIDLTIAPYKKEMERQMNAKVSHTNIELTKTGNNSTLGALLADYTLQGAEEWARQNALPTPDAAVINIGGIRSTIGKGDILVKHIFEVMPFENEVVIVKIKGTDIQGLFDYYAQTQKNNPVSRLLIEIHQGQVAKALVNGQPIDLNRDYYIATSDYLALGGDNMKFFGKGELISTGIKLRDLFIQKFKEHTEVSIPTDVRLIFQK